MELHDLKTFSEIGYALWSDPERSRKISVDTLGAVALRDFDEETLLESGTQALLARAANEGSANNSRYNPYMAKGRAKMRLALAMRSGKSPCS